MKVSLVLFAGIILAVISGHRSDAGDPAVNSEPHVLRAKLLHEKNVEEPEHIKKLFRRKAEKPVLEKQKQLLLLLKRVLQDPSWPEHVEIAGSFNPFDSQDTTLYLKDGVVEKFHKYRKYAPLARGAIFSIYDQNHIREAVALFNMLYYAKDFDTFYKTAVWARKNVNEGMFVYSLYVAVVHRADTKGIMLPPIYEVTPHMFFGAAVITKAQYYKQIHETKQHVEGKEFEGYTIESNYSNHHLNLDHEQTSLAYYLQDVGVNTFFFNMHINFPFWMNSTEFGWNNIPRGSLYYFSSQNIWARYIMERVPYGYDDIEFLDWDLPVVTPYHSNLVYPNGVPFPNRPKFAKLHEYSYNYGQNRWAGNYNGLSHTFVRDLERRIGDAIASGAIWNETMGELVKIESEEFMNVLGNLIEGNIDSPNLHAYGPIWHFARHLLGYSTQQLDQNEVVPSALEHFETTLRDPVFYQLLHKLVIIPFQMYLSRLPAYTKGELIFNGVEVTDVEMDPLVTYNEVFYSILKNSVFYKPHEAHGDFHVRVRQLRLNHIPFEYKIHVKSDKSQKVLIKIFMGPKYDRDGRPIHLRDNRLHFVDIDSFKVDLQTGDNVVTRKSTDTEFYTPDKVSYHDLWQNTVAALEDNKEVTTDLRQNWYGYPQRFMIPKGSPGGTPYQFFFAVHPDIENPNTVTTDNLGVILSDNSPMKFPLDRFIEFDKMWEHMPNFHFKEVKVYFKGDEDSL
ncbi:hypothetical protein JTB14_010216 [Gonioctena quinquepunctata]|nr:hypothetical protein JTB14_010216 [Gonioctena quinquepunctata]